ncbi:nuclear transport factor 2 family protein [Pseudonocardia acidicola]|uniref:Nuclear transport factor 2 family protein n=1 Tax=Pseudonocardia acidicola TaxID=2724939 RepID=A0ABX1SBF2_9PSEU|nr:nuclear transport factor 2 family protein [Pseudonocardia acidicola]NMH97818.1 nuclear transport factor 2 family protein [Pseudonocardia acidicola]
MFEDNHIRNSTTRRFVGALRHFEQQGDIGPLVALFTEDAVLFRLDGRGERRGDVRRFWQEYRAQFAEVRTRFLNAVEGADTVEGYEEAGLEWHSEGRLADGRPLDYYGSTFLALDGDLITGLRSYYDTAVFVKMPVVAH